MIGPLLVQHIQISKCLSLFQNLNDTPHMHGSIQYLPYCTWRTTSKEPVLTFESRCFLTVLWPIKGIHVHAFYEIKLEKS